MNKFCIFAIIFFHLNLFAHSLDNFAEKLFVPLKDQSVNEMIIELKSESFFNALKKEGINHPGKILLKKPKNEINFNLVSESPANQKIDKIFYDSVNYLVKYLQENLLLTLIKNSKVRIGDTDNLDSYILTPENDEISEIQIILKEDNILQYIEKKPIGTINAFYEYKKHKNNKLYLSKLIINRYEGIERKKEVLTFKYDQIDKLFLPTVIDIKIDQSISLSSQDKNARVIEEKIDIFYQIK